LKYSPNTQVLIQPPCNSRPSSLSWPSLPLAYLHHQEHRPTSTSTGSTTIRPSPLLRKRRSPVLLPTIRTIWDHLQHL
jgi:hypothetical protein